ncbi:MAG: NADPH dehydrogenase NamA [Caldilineae bacterium]|nr:MAG: NADPH dehydrogenase NamA [Caldilineae bacterium]
MSVSLFSPFVCRGLRLKNRIVMAPMCMYTAAGDGLATDWHWVHYGARAIGGVGLIIQEATAVEFRGRISEQDLGLWCDEQIAPLARIVDFVHGQGAAMGIQLAHAGRKAWTRNKGRGPAAAVGPSPIPFADDFPPPHELSSGELDGIVEAFAAAARRALAAGYDVIEIHSAHGYLLHSFVSPISNRRQDEYGGSIENRARLLWRVAEAVRAVWPEDRPLFTRISATDWVDGGLRVEDWEVVVAGLKERGVDVIDCSSGGLVPDAVVPAGPGYQVAFAAHIRRACDIPTVAVGLITTPEQAETIVRSGQADLVALAREFLRSPQWPLAAARALGAETEWPRQYLRARL